MDCIDLWLATHTTCPLCRLSLLPSTRSLIEPADNSNQPETSDRPPEEENRDEGSPRYCSHSCEDPPQLAQQMTCSSSNRVERTSETNNLTERESS